MLVMRLEQMNISLRSFLLQLRIKEDKWLHVFLNRPTNFQKKVTETLLVSLSGTKLFCKDGVRNNERKIL